MIRNLLDNITAEAYGVWSPARAVYHGRDGVWVQYSAQLQIALCQEVGLAGDGSFVARIWQACDGLRR